MKTYLFPFVFILFVIRISAQNIGPNSSFFSLNNFYTPNEELNYEEYSVNGFYENSAASVARKIILLPQISIKKEIELIDSEGIITTNPNFVKFLKLAPKYSSNMPNQYEAIGIMASINGRQIHYPTLPLIKNGNLPVIFPPALSNYNLVTFINNTYRVRDSLLRDQNTLLADWNDRSKYLPELATTDGFIMSVIVNGITVASQCYTGTLIPNSDLPIITITNPSKAVINTIIRGSYDLLIEYRIKDNRLSAISASIDVDKIINHYIEESQQIITSESSKGLSVFGIRFRKNSLSQNIDHQLSEQLRDNSSTRISLVADNASDEMYSDLLQMFFPSITKGEVILNHEKAAKDAEAQGNMGVAKIHRDYIDAIKSQDPQNDIDPILAAAALASQNYAAFIASGIRAVWGNTSGEFSFRRVLTRDISQEIRNKYSIAKHYNVARLCQISISPTIYRNRGPLIGWTSVMPYTAQIGPTTRLSGLIIGGVVERSPLHAANIVPGMMILGINGHACTSPSAADNIINHVKPGETIKLDIADGYGITSYNIDTKIGIPR